MNAVVFSAVLAALPAEALEKPEDPGLCLLVYTEARLGELKAGIEAYVKHEVAKDGRASVLEVESLSRLVTEFMEEKAHLDSRLRPYSLASKTAIDPGLGQAVESYSRVLKRHDNDGLLRERVSLLAGRNLEVETRSYWELLGCGLIAIIVGIACFVRGMKFGRKSYMVYAAIALAIGCTEIFVFLSILYFCR